MSTRFKQFVTIFGINFILWLLLVGNLSAAEVVAGFVVSTLTAMFVLEKTTLFDDLRIELRAPFSLVAYLGVFFVELVRANLDMARRVLSPKIPLKPELVRVRTTLESDLGKLVLANSITLTPGTLSVDVEGDEILVHWIECPDDYDIEMATSVIAANFEKHLKGFLK